MTDLIFVPVRYLEAAWPKVEHLVSEAVERSEGKYLAEDIKELLFASHMQMWLMVGDGILGLTLTELRTYPRNKICRLLCCVGEQMESWIDKIDIIEAWAKGEGCLSIEPICRAGWERVLKPRGYKKTHVLLAKELA